ncbi:MAG: CheY-P-specific phosphatase CheC [Gemmatimonadales bacterium]|nr:MAG: CheY-P-specific phosphatase CheC [Gemmatimonadales bacterium]
MTDLRSLGEAELDALREVANIGGGHAATALSELTGQRIMVTVPRIFVASEEAVRVASRGTMRGVVAVQFSVAGDLSLEAWLVVDEGDARRFCDALLGRSPGSTTTLGHMERSSLEEAANILVGAYLNALSELMGTVLMPSVPAFRSAMLAAVLEEIFRSDAGTLPAGVGPGLGIETRFHMGRAGDPVLPALLLLLPDRVSVGVILRALRVI